MEKYISIPNVDSDMANVLIRVSKIFSASAQNNGTLLIQYMDKARDLYIYHDSATNFEMAEWLQANILKANSHKKDVTEASEPPLSITQITS